MLWRNEDFSTGKTKLRQKKNQQNTKEKEKLPPKQSTQSQKVCG